MNEENTLERSIDFKEKHTRALRLGIILWWCVSKYVNECMQKHRLRMGAIFIYPSTHMKNTSILSYSHHYNTMGTSMLKAAIRLRVDTET